MSNATRTPQQAMADAIKSGAVQAWMDGKKIEFFYQYNDRWYGFENRPNSEPGFTSPAHQWRTAPTPRLRPWKPEEVPVGAQYHDYGWLAGVRATIVSAGIDAFSYIIDDEIRCITCQAAVQYGEHSLDGGKTWHPCGVQEGGE